MSQTKENGDSVTARRRNCMAMSLVELIMALVILSILATAITFLLQGAARTNSIVSATIDTQWQIELAFRRMVQQTRLCTALSVPSGTTSGSSFTVITEPDSANGMQTYTVTYSLITAADGTKQLQEANSNPNIGTSILVQNVQAFTCQLNNVGTPVMLVMNITAGASTPSSRTVRVATRNL